jgi:hypothetical protein
VRIAGATIVPGPSIVLCVHVRNVRMTLPVYFHVVLGYGPGILISGRRRSARWLGSSCGRRTAFRNVPTADRRVTAANRRVTGATV